MTSRGFAVWFLRLLPVVAMLALALPALALPPGDGPGARSVAPPARTSGGCSPSSSTCYLFDLTLSGTGFGTYTTINGNGEFTGRVDCRYGNEDMTGTCGWGYELPTPNGQYTIVYEITPDAGSQVCDSSTCHGSNVVNDAITISGNYGEARWRFELISHVQIDVEVKGKGSGAVTSDPVGIVCPGDCDDLYAAGFPVALVAKPAAGSVFGGWSGGCTGNELICEVTPEFLTSVTATFTKKATPPPVTEKPPTDEPTEPTEPTEEPPPEPTEVVASQTAAPVETTAPTVAPTIPSSALPVATALPSPTGSTDIGNLPIVIGLAVVLVLLVGGAVLVARRPSG